VNVNHVRKAKTNVSGLISGFVESLDEPSLNIRVINQKYEVMDQKYEKEKAEY